MTSGISSRLEDGIVYDHERCRSCTFISIVNGPFSTIPRRMSQYVLSGLQSVGLKLVVKKMLKMTRRMRNADQAEEIEILSHLPSAIGSHSSAALFPCHLPSSCRPVYVQHPNPLYHGVCHVICAHSYAVTRNAVVISMCMRRSQAVRVVFVLSVKSMRDNRSRFLLGE